MITPSLQGQPERTVSDRTVWMDGRRDVKEVGIQDKEKVEPEMVLHQTRGDGSVSPPGALLITPKGKCYAEP